MLTVFHKHFEIQISSFINRQGNTSYLLYVYDYKRGGAFAYCLIRYQWAGGTQYLLLADRDGLVYPCAVRVKDLLDGFNWSCVRREIKAIQRFREVWYGK